MGGLSQLQRPTNEAADFIRVFAITDPTNDGLVIEQQDLDAPIQTWRPRVVFQRTDRHRPIRDDGPLQLHTERLPNRICRRNEPPGPTTSVTRDVCKSVPKGYTCCLERHRRQGHRAGCRLASLVKRSRSPPKLQNERRQRSSEHDHGEDRETHSPLTESDFECRHFFRDPVLLCGEHRSGPGNQQRVPGERADRNLLHPPEAAAAGWYGLSLCFQRLRQNTPPSGEEAADGRRPGCALRRSLSPTYKRRRARKKPEPDQGARFPRSEARSRRKPFDC